jgi:hypothetical protein
MADASSEVTAVAKLFHNGGLPLNRKEVYFTATVLPGIICADNFIHFGKFLDLLGIKGLGAIDATKIQFFTEYSFASTIDDEDSHLADFEGKHQQPDLLILIGGAPTTLIVVEAKMYSPVGKQSLVAQMESQERELWYWINAKKPESRVVHAALLPQQMMPGIDNLGDCKFPHADRTRPVITWENIAEEFKNVSSGAYFVGVLNTALDKYPALVNQGWETEQYSDAKLPGVEIVAGYLRHNGKYHMMGRVGGIRGPKLRGDINTQRWWTYEYEVNVSPQQRPHWFPISEFVKLVQQPEKSE